MTDDGYIPELELERATEGIKAPFPYVGGKRRIASVVWRAMGDVGNYIEPFFGSGAVLLSRPAGHRRLSETVNDIDGMIANVWRSLALHPDEVAAAADWPVNENDLFARHHWLVSRRDDITAKLEGDPNWCDPKAAGWWIWGCCAWIGAGWCNGQGPWGVVDGERTLVGKNGIGISRKRPHIGNNGTGINRKLDDNTCAGWRAHLQSVFVELSDRLRNVRVCCGDWSRVCSSPTVTVGLHPPCGVFLDPPYTADANRASRLYAKDSTTVGYEVAEWCKQHGDDPKMRIVLCGYDCEYDLPGWRVTSWSSGGGYGRLSRGIGVQGNFNRERLWLSPHCNSIATTELSVTE